MRNKIVAEVGEEVANVLLPLVVDCRIEDALAVIGELITNDVAKGIIHLCVLFWLTECEEALASYEVAYGK